jgi:prepilin-type N-terminal cleavage/methylation domain-containing protein
MKTPSRILSAFSLIELLVVVAILGIMAAASSVALTGSSKSLSGAASAASTLFGLARTEAIMRRVPARVIVDTVYDPAKPDNYLRRIAVVVRNDAGNGWEQVSRWTPLPGKAFYNKDVSRKHDSETISGLAGGAAAGPYEFFEFSPNGQAAGRAQFVLSTGKVEGGTFQETGSESRAGFYLHKMGKPTFFTDPSEIPTPW